MKVSLILIIFSNKNEILTFSIIHIKIKKIQLIRDCKKFIIKISFYSISGFKYFLSDFKAIKKMQHLNKVSDPVFSRKWNFDQNWNSVENTLLRENQ